MHGGLFLICSLEIILLFYGVYFTNDSECDKICNMNRCVLLSEPRRTGCAAMRRAAVICVILLCLLSMCAFALEIPENITSIEEGAFIGNRTIDVVEIPAAVKFIGEEAFADCENLTTIRINAKDITLEDNALGRLGEKRTIIGHDGTIVEEYANLYGFTFQPITTKATKLLEYAHTLLGRPYSEMDCVGFVNKCYRTALGMNTGAVTTNNEDGRFPNASNFGKLDQYNKKAKKITKISDLQPGDIICWKNDDVSWCTHVGIYVGKGTINGKAYNSGVFIDSSYSNQSVGYRLIPATGGGYYTRNFMFAWRIIDQ